MRRRALVLLLAGCPGILSLLLALPAVRGVPPPALLLQPALLLALSTVAGSWAAARCGLSLAAGSRPAERMAQGATGILLGLAVATADHAMRELWQAAPSAPPSLLEAWSAGRLLVGLLYGAVVEEVMFRWCAMSLVVLALWRSLARGAARPPRWILTAAALIAALLFAAGHVPALAPAGALPDAGALLRTLLLNGIAGSVFGLLFARRDLAAAMLAHGGAHLGFAAAALAFDLRP